jgi:hypothetical protein
MLVLWVRMPAGGNGYVFGIVVCCRVEVSVFGRSLVQRSPTECGVIECDREASTMRRPWALAVAVAPRVKKR